MIKSQVILVCQSALKNDFLRQIVAYEYPNYAWEKDNFSLREEYKDLVREVLSDINCGNDGKN